MKRKLEEKLENKLLDEKKSKLLENNWHNEENEEIIDINSGKINFTKENENEIYSLYPGRKSFGGFNTKVETYCREVEDNQKFEKIAKKIVSEEEMITRYHQSIGLPLGSGKNHHENFLKSNKTKSNKKNKIKHNK